ncbi:MAG: glycine C-acetyltransferase [Deltaproteobacteria bacterium]|jgi:glycine C-acetyltransferase|nr:glycine C-acetyltransferase [Deltaproteobacteria bacterium]
MPKLDFLKNDLKDLHESGLYNVIRTLEGANDPWVKINGEKRLNLTCNNYLGLANHPEMVKAAKDAIDRYGVGAGAVRSIAGTMDLHIRLEEALAKFKGREACVVFQSGFVSNSGVIPAIIRKSDVIFSDELNHASVIDGCRLTKAPIMRYKHNNMEELENLIKENQQYERKYIVTDGVFSMDGDIADLKSVADLADKYDCVVIVDDAHGEGVLGKGGRGVVNHLGLGERIDVEVGTLSKAFGCAGGFVAGNKDLIEWIKQRGRPFLFSNALSPSEAAGCLKAVELLEKSEELVSTLWDNSKYFKASMNELGFDIGHSDTPITPIMLGEASTAHGMSKKLFEEKVFAMALGYPTVPKGKARIRVMVSAGHSKDDLNYGIEKFTSIGREFGVIK